MADELALLKQELLDQKEARRRARHEAAPKIASATTDSTAVSPDHDNSPTPDLPAPAQQIREQTGLDLNKVQGQLVLLVFLIVLGRLFGKRD